MWLRIAVENRIVAPGSSRYPARRENYKNSEIAVERVQCEADSRDVAQPGCG